MGRIIRLALKSFKTYYISPSGSDTTGRGTKLLPWFSLQKLNGIARPGDKILARGGTYDVDTATGWFITYSGRAGQRIKVWAYPGETPVIDLTNCTAPPSDYSGVSDAGGSGIVGRNVSYIHFKGITVQQAPMIGWEFYGSISGAIGTNGIDGPGCHGLIWEMCNAYYCGRNGEVGSGWLCSGRGTNNYILNCDSAYNKDTDGGGNSDGFEYHFKGAGNRMHGLRAMYNSDDGYDMLNNSRHTNRAGGTVVISSCWAFKNGYLSDNTTLAGGDGNGFKLGGQRAGVTGNTSGGHTTKNCLSWSNLVNGFDDNEATISNILYNNTGYNNNRGGGSPGFNGNFVFEGTSSIPILRNNLSHAPAASSQHATVTGGAFGDADSQFNSWDAGTGVTVSAADFLSLVATTAEGARNADGSLPVSDFLKLVGGSDLINEGTPVPGIPYNSTAPDLGAYEYAA